MIKNFEGIKSQLKELSEIVNSFKSEAVQLRIVELVFGFEPEEEEKPYGEGKPIVKKRKAVKIRPAQKDGTNSVPKKAGNKPSGQGAVATLGKLVEEGFFRQPKSIGDIVEHCDHNLARKFKANEFSGKLGRLVRDNSLTRTKNSESQYEYQSK
jgi:hypothetical protein